MATTKTTDAPHPISTNVFPYSATEMFVVVAAAKADVVLVIALPVVVMLHSSVKSATVPGTVQLNLAAQD